MSCQKIGCTDPYAENYSVYANKDDGSCIYKDALTVTVSEWEFYDFYYGATIFWDALTQEAIDKSVIQIFYG